MTHSSFYDDRRYCPRCRAYVAYLLAWERAYCAACGGVVALFSPNDMAAFHRGDRHLDELEATR